MISDQSYIILLIIIIILVDSDNARWIEKYLLFSSWWKFIKLLNSLISES